MATSLKKTIPSSHTKQDSTAPLQQPASENRTTQIASLRLDHAERAGGGIVHRFWRFLRILVMLALLGGGGFAAYTHYFDQLPMISVDEIRGRVAAIWSTRFGQAKAELPSSQVNAYRIPDPAAEDVFLSLAGFIRPQTEVRVGPKIPGTIVKVPVDQGSVVKKGELLAQIEATSYQADLEQANATLALAEANLLELQNGALPEEVEDARAALKVAEAQRDFRAKERDRIRRLKDSRNSVVTDSQFDAADSEFKRTDAQARSLQQKLNLVERGTRPEKIAAAKAKVDEARAMVTRARFFVENAAIVAPIDATVLEKQTEAGEIVRPDVLLSDMFVLADLTRLQAEVDVQERDLHRISIGNVCRICPDAYPDRSYAGRIQKIKPQINRQRAVAGVEVAVLKPDGYLIPNMNCRVEFLSKAPSNAAGAVRIPAATVVKDGNDSVVYTLEESRARRRVVKADVARDGWVEIREGLARGDVVLLPTEGVLQDGQQVAARFASTGSSTASETRPTP